MKNLKDSKTKIMPSKTRGGKDLPSISTFDSPTILSQPVTLPPPHISYTAISHTICTASASAIDDTQDDASTLFDRTARLGTLLDAHISKAK